MNKKKHFLFIIFFSTTTTILFAQAPGHLGKRFVLGYGAHFSPAIFSPDARNNSIIGRSDQVGSATTGQFAYNYTHEAYIEFALSTRFMLGFSGKFYRTNYDNALDISKSFNNNIYSQIDNDVRGSYEIRGQSLCLYGKLFSKRYVAPWGRYMVFGPIINLYNTTYDPSIMYQSATNKYTNESLKVSNYGALNQSYMGFNILIGWGRSRIIANRFVLDYGFSMQAISIVAILFDANLIERTNLYDSDYIEKTAGTRIRALNRCNAFIKMGFLIF